MGGLNATEIEQASVLVCDICQDGVTIIWVEHVLKAIMNCSNRVVVINQGEKIADAPPGEDRRESRGDHRLPGDEEAINPMLSIEKLQVSYGKIQALWDVTIEVPDGEIVALIGANGAGKTTLLKTVSGLLRKQSGSITYDGLNIDAASPPEIVKQGVVHVPEGRKLFPEMTVMDNLLMGAYTIPLAKRRQRLEEIFGIFPILKERMAADRRDVCPAGSNRWWRSAGA